MNDMNQKQTTSKLLTCAGVLLLAAGVLMAICSDLVIAAILWAGAFCMLFAAYHFRIAEDKQDKEKES